jgi:hypothetical protein
MFQGNSCLLAFVQAAIVTLRVTRNSPLLVQAQIKSRVLVPLGRKHDTQCYSIWQFCLQVSN